VTLMMLIFPADAVHYARESLSLCSETVIPSLFPFFICSGLLVYSGFCQVLSVLTKPIMKPLFNVNENGSGAFILGIISGYPLGAVTACQLYESGYLSKYETERLLSFCNNSGPLFILGAMGICMYQSRQIGVLLYISHLLAALTVGIIFRFYKQKKHCAPDTNFNHAQKDLSGIYSVVMQNSLNSIITICGSVIFFGVAINLIVSQLPLEPGIKAIITSVMEMTGGIKEISTLHLDLATRLVISATVVGFAGFCVHLQVLSVVSRYNLSLFPYIIGKILHGAVSGMYLYFILKFFPIASPVFSQISQPMSFGFYIASFFITVTVLFFLILSAISYLSARKKAV